MPEHSWECILAVHIQNNHCPFAPKAKDGQENYIGPKYLNNFWSLFTDIASYVIDKGPLLRGLWQMKNETVDVETIDILLIGDEKEIAVAIRLIDTYFRYKIVEIIKTVALSATREDRFDVYQEVLLAISEKAKNKNYNPDKNTLLTMIRTIAHNKATDWVRKKYARKRGVDASVGVDDIVDSVAEAINDSKVKEPWQNAQRNDQRSAVLKTLRSLVTKLKLRQRQVAEVIIVNFPNMFDLADLQVEILKRYNENVTIQSLKRAREEVLSKVREALSITGYGEDINE